MSFAVVPAVVIAIAADARAQTATTGVIRGRVTDKRSKQPLADVTIVAGTGAAQQTVLSGDDGTYELTGLLPGDYVVTFFYGDSTVFVKTHVGADQITPLYPAIDVKIEEIHMYDDGPLVESDPTLHHRVRRDELTKEPIPGATFESAMGGTPGSARDSQGVALSGSTSAENRYVIDGVDTTGLRYGSAGTPVLNEFIEEIDVITGGYNAEYGRATGGVVNVVTRTGHNETEGDLFFYARPGAFTAARVRTPSEATSIDAREDLDVDGNAGGLISGALVKDRLWYVLGVAPTYTQDTITRTVRRHTDCRQLMPDGNLSDCDPRSVSAGGHADGKADVDPATGFHIDDDLAVGHMHPYTAGANILAKLNYAMSPEEQGQVSLSAIPTSTRSYGVYGLPSTTNFDVRSLTTDLAGKWTAKLNDNKTELEGVLGWHRERAIAQNHDPAARNLPLEILYGGDLGTWSNIAGSGESPATRAGCSDAAGSGDLYPLITNCPDEGVGYRVGGGGSFSDDVKNRYAGKLSLTQRVKALGSHEIKAGADVEDDRLDEARAYTGGVFYENYLDQNTVFANLWVQAAAPGVNDPRFDRTCRYTPSGQSLPTELGCRYIGQHDEGSRVAGETFNWASYLRDSWQLRPNLTVDYGLRYEEQRLRYAGYLQDEIDPATAQPYGKNALTLRNMWAPRVGVLYDWTREGRSKVYGHWGRFYESIPMDINSRSFGGEINYQLTFATRDGQGNSQCGQAPMGYGGPSGTGCDLDHPDSTDLIGLNGSLVAPGLKPQYLDEWILGAEYEIKEDLKVGVSYQQRNLGRVIEDVSTDGAQTYVIANPGEWDDGERAKLEQQIAMAGSPAEKQRLQNLLAQYSGISSFDKPSRDYRALQMVATWKASKDLFWQASYTYSRTTGNYPGLIAYDTGQVDPNISSQYDLIELLANRYGKLPQDRPHYLKLDGYYTIDLHRTGALTLGLRGRALSGTPRNALGRHALYGIGESFLLPRGVIGRTSFEESLDLHVGFGRKLSHGMALEVYADLFNLFDNQGTAEVDDNYTYDSAANPVVDGAYDDLVFAKENVLAGASRGLETSTPIKRNPNFGHTTARYAPLSAQVGARLSF